ncbi:MAG: pantoate--beta-alanine ligase [Proteobacteria bacterium]|nr:pantoate--beta-alanine ligase [Pseudomonadota bacterium]
MDVVHTAADLRASVSAWRREGARVAFVPTMGNLHAGHLSLVELARKHAHKVVASVFVNPTQFGPNEDFASYPRTLDADRASLAAHDCDVLFAPGVDEIYPFGVSESVRVDVPKISEVLEGELRPGHFTGVATVVTKLFNLVQPDVAVFGQKDYQQLLVVRRMTMDLRLPIDIIAAPTRRESNGLAMSSRNQYLSSGERERAGVIHRVLCAMREQWDAGRSIAAIESDARLVLEAAGSVPDYATIRRAADLSAPGQSDRRGAIALIATRIGRARLIDNLLLDP